MNHAMKKCWALLLGLLLVTALPACNKLGADTPENRLKAAQEHQLVSPLKTTIDNAINDMSKQFPPDKREDFIRFMRANVDMNLMEQKAVQAMANHFTLREIKALTNFYRSPEGKAINQKYGDYLADLMPVIQSQLGRAGNAWLMQQQQQELQKAPPEHGAPGAQPAPPAAPAKPEPPKAAPEKQGPAK
ncbi:MAG: DUF2059 domain-containing protein [Desulfobacteraceae bacterium]|nr:DUF2059 domain-containing protein [Desulfobacteraceae bacterium]